MHHLAATACHGLHRLSSLGDSQRSGGRTCLLFSPGTHGHEQGVHSGNGKRSKMVGASRYVTVSEVS